MNCRPGDMAVVVTTRVDADHRLPQEVLGCVVTVVSVVEMVGDCIAMWQLKAPMRWVAERHYSLGGTVVFPGNEVGLGRLPDTVLQPIRGLTADTPAKFIANV